MPFFAPAGALALPQLIWLNGGLGTKGSLSFRNGYLVDNFRFDNPGSYADFVSYWWLNLGLVGPLVLLAAVVGRRADRKLLAAVMAIFVAGNLVTFGLDVGGHSHKVFNLWEVLVNLFAAYGLVWISRTIWKGLPAARRGLGVVAGRILALVVVPALGVLLVLSGLLDFMTMKNDSRYDVFGPDWQPAISWIEHHTSRNAIFLTGYDEVYTIPTLAGRSVYLGGYSGWSAGMGYDDASRQKKIASIYAAPNQATACNRLRGTGADYIQVSDSELKSDHYSANVNLFPGRFVRVFSDDHFSYYDVKASCGSRGVTAPRGT